MKDFYKREQDLHEKTQREQSYKLYEQALELEKQGDYSNALNLFIQAAEQGNTTAQCYLGDNYYFGNGVEQDFLQAINWYKKAADTNAAEGLWRLGSMYEFGEGVEQDYSVAIQYYEMSAMQCNPIGQWRLGYMYQFGNGLQKDLIKAVNLYRKSAEQGNSEGQWRLGYMYQFGQGVIQDYDIAVKWFSESANYGDSTGQWRLGYMYEFGQGVEKNYSSAVSWYKKSAKQGDSEGQWRLGAMYESGRGVEIDCVKAAEWYQKSSDQGNPEGQSGLAYLYQNGKGVEKNRNKAIELYQKAAESNDAMALNNLGCIYEDEKNYAYAQYWYKRGAELGYSYPIWNLGQLYEQGFGVESSIDKAIELYIKACNTDFDPCPNAMYRMGYAYYDGYGVERNLEKAKEYFERAIKQGYHCSYALNMVKGELGELNDSNKMREYADGLIKKHIPNTKLYQQISKDLQNDFGDMWNITCRETKKFLETGMFTYFSLYSLGPHIYGNMDFSASITPMFKALEKELRKYLYSGYLEFLKKQDISPNTFQQKRSFIKRVNSTELAYRDSSDLTEFTLGNLHLTVGLERKPQFAENDTFKYTVDQTMLDYLNSIFKKDAFGEAKREREITDYIISLTQEVTSIADSLRNPAAHSETMKCQKAEACGNYIIKVQRLLIDFVEKIKFLQNEEDKK